MRRRVAVVFLCGKKARFVFFRLCVALRNVGATSETEVHNKALYLFYLFWLT